MIATAVNTLIFGLDLGICNLQSTMLCDLEFCIEHQLENASFAVLISAIRQVVSFEFVYKNSFSSSFTILTTVLGCFLIMYLAIFSLYSYEENKSILSLSLHCSVVVLQLWTNSSVHLCLKAVRVSSLL